MILIFRPGGYVLSNSQRHPPPPNVWLIYSLNGAGEFVKSVRLPPVAVVRFTSRLRGDSVCPVKAMLLPVGDQMGGKPTSLMSGEMITLSCVPFSLIVAMPRVEVVNAILVPSGDHCGHSA